MTDTTAAAPAQESTGLPPAGATPETAQPEVHPQSDTAADASNGERPHRAEGRIKELVAERDVGLEYGEFWRKRYEDLAQQRPAQEAAPQPQEQPRPKRVDFNDDDAWADALAEWTDARATRKAEAAAEARFAKSREEERLRTQQSTFAARSQSFAQAHPDFPTAISNPALTFMNGEFLGVIVESEKGPELAYHIAKSPELVARLARQSPAQRLATLGRIEADLSRPPPAPKVSSAPPPPTPITSAASGGTVDLEKLSAKEYLQVRLEQRAAKGKR